MSRLLEAYRAVHDQAFLPIFVDDEFDSKMLVEACLAAGMKAIEYTLRRRDAHKMIPWIREKYPDVYLLVGSTVDSERIVAKAKRFHPHLLTIAELDAMGVDGFVSMLGWSRESIERYSPRRLVMPTATTPNEAFFQVAAGAHFAKLSGKNLDMVRACRMDAAFGYCPMLVTGGMTPERIPEAMSAGAVLVATGFDLTLKGESKNILPGKVTQVMKLYLSVAAASRQKFWPELTPVAKADDKAWLAALPHHHPF